MFFYPHSFLPTVNIQPVSKQDHKTILFLGTKAITESPQKPEEKRGEKRKASEMDDNGKKVGTARKQTRSGGKKLKLFQLSVHFCLPSGKSEIFPKQHPKLKGNIKAEVATMHPLVEETDFCSCSSLPAKSTQLGLLR